MWAGARCACVMCCCCVLGMFVLHCVRCVRCGTLCGAVGCVVCGGAHGVGKLRAALCAVIASYLGCSTEIDTIQGVA